ncbi:hypothetical protein OIE66_34625 [Nonomuraea sp. NBC_01738]|uniref:hypothetical protein n=1 Tax=Nonomuraea sp. NBC_01738 TaxID=2976003 RepID=UPI002E123771|nr:hypothetical protein OIE66_34625 [Nonomuraea sp. NBC_01738]
MRRFAPPLVGLALLLTGCGLNTPDHHETRAFPYQATTLRIASTLGGLRVEPGAPGAITVDRWTRGKAAEAGKATWKLTGETLSLSADCTMIFGDCGSRYKITVPPGVKLVIDASDGIILTGLTQDLDVTARAAIQLRDVSGALRLRSKGMISGERLRSPQVRARTGVGAVDLTFLVRPAAVDLATVGGPITAKVPDGAYRVSATSTEGRVDSKLKSTQSANTIKARTRDGNILISAD